MKINLDQRLTNGNCRVILSYRMKDYIHGWLDWTEAPPYEGDLGRFDPCPVYQIMASSPSGKGDRLSICSLWVQIPLLPPNKCRYRPKVRTHAFQASNVGFESHYLYQTCILS